MKNDHHKNRSSFGIARKRLEVTARTASKNIEVEVDKPLGLTLGQKPGGGVVITVSILNSPPFSYLHISLYISFFNQEIRTWVLFVRVGASDLKWVERSKFLIYCGVGTIRGGPRIRQKDELKLVGYVR